MEQLGVPIREDLNEDAVADHLSAVVMPEEQHLRILTRRAVGSPCNSEAGSVYGLHYFAKGLTTVSRLSMICRYCRSSTAEAMITESLSSPSPKADRAERGIEGRFGGSHVLPDDRT